MWPVASTPEAQRAILEWRNVLLDSTAFQGGCEEIAEWLLQKSLSPACLLHWPRIEEGLFQNQSLQAGVMCHPGNAVMEQGEGKSSRIQSGFSFPDGTFWLPGFLSQPSWPTAFGSAFPFSCLRLVTCCSPGKWLEANARSSWARSPVLRLQDAQTLLSPDPEAAAVRPAAWPGAISIPRPRQSWSWSFARTQCFWPNVT